MIIGLPKEIKQQEHRVALLPSSVYQLRKRGHAVVVERGAGAGSGYSDADYAQAGATMVDAHAAVFELAAGTTAGWPLLTSIAAQLVVLLSALAMLIDPTHRALHDHVAGTRVVIDDRRP